MSDVDDLVLKLEARLNAKDDFKAVVAFEIQDRGHTVVIDATQRPVVVGSEETPKAIFKAKAKTFEGLLDGSVNPMTAIPLRQLKFEGSNGVAMHLLRAII